MEIGREELSGGGLDGHGDVDSLDERDGITIDGRGQSGKSQSNGSKRTDSRKASTAFSSETVFSVGIAAGLTVEATAKLDVTGRDWEIE